MASHWYLQKVGLGIHCQYKDPKTQEWSNLRVGRCLSKCSFLLKFCPQYAQKTILMIIFGIGLEYQTQVSSSLFNKQKKPVKEILEVTDD